MLGHPAVGQERTAAVKRSDHCWVQLPLRRRIRGRQRWTPGPAPPRLPHGRQPVRPVTRAAGKTRTAGNPHSGRETLFARPIPLTAVQRGQGRAYGQSSPRSHARTGPSTRPVDGLHRAYPRASATCTTPSGMDRHRRTNAGSGRTLGHLLKLLPSLTLPWRHRRLSTMHATARQLLSPVDSRAAAGRRSPRGDSCASPSSKRESIT